MNLSRWLMLLVALATGLLLLPVVAYLAGGRLAGPYAGPRGLASYLTAIYGDAVDGRPPALLLLAGPLLCVLVWWLRAWFLGRAKHSHSTD